MEEVAEKEPLSMEGDAEKENSAADTAAHTAAHKKVHVLMPLPSSCFDRHTRRHNHSMHSTIAGI